MGLLGRLDELTVLLCLCLLGQSRGLPELALAAVELGGVFVSDVGEAGSSKDGGGCGVGTAS